MKLAKTSRVIDGPHSIVFIIYLRPVRSRKPSCR